MQKWQTSLWNLPVPGGFGIALGNKTASFIYAPPNFANEGIPCVIVTFQSLASSVGFFQNAFDEDESSTEQWVLEPIWDSHTNSLIWRDGSATRSSMGIVRLTMEMLQRKQS